MRMSVRLDGLPVPVTGITDDSRKVRPGHAFVAVRGTRLNGNAFAGDAVRRGAAVIISESPPLDMPVPVVEVPDARRALSRYAAAFYEHPSRSMTVTGVTGTNGKTTTASILRRILNAHVPTGLISSVNTVPRGPVDRSTLTTPGAVELQSLLYHMQEEDVKHVVLEVTSIALEQQRTADVDFDAAIFTNFSEDHMDHHRSIDAYRGAKARLFAGLTPQQPAFWNLDDPHHEWFQAQTDAFPITYSVRRLDADVTALNASVDQGGLNYICRLAAGPALGLTETREFAVEMPILGVHNITNSLAAIAAASYFDVPISTIQAALSDFTGVARRLQVIQDGPVQVIDDFAHNPAGFQRLLETVRNLKARRRLLLVALRSGRGADINAANARVLARGVTGGIIDRLYVTGDGALGDGSRVADGDERRAFVNVLEERGIPFEFEEDLRPLLETVLEAAEAGDLVVLAGGRNMDEAGQLVREHLQIPKGSL